MRTPRDRRECTQVDVYPEEHDCPACQPALKERYHQQRWIVRLDQHGQVVSHFLACGHVACSRRAVVYRPYQEDALALRGYSFGLDVVARIGERRYRDNWSIPKLRGQRQRESNLSISLQEVALRCEVCLALVTTVAHQDQELMEQLRPVGRIVRAIAGVQPEKSDEPLDMVRDVCSGRVFVAKTLLSRATGEIEQLIEDVLGLG